MWKYGVPLNAKCCLKYKQQNWWECEGQVDKKYKLSGIGKWSSDSGLKYKGQLKNGSSHGFGEAVFPNGSKFEGFWKKQNMHGHGKYFYLDGSYEEGEYKDGIKQGESKYFTKEGQLIEFRIYENGKLIKKFASN
ncbi:hypothetical protein FGO68_gene15648 [Halteria grandinella]|uniref:MORN repeat protein n=1 Tax=Halteria grandinella TaxID=5974 RepID=A0A8J8NQA2_HALGN|nr:hypothetical protein FGO68_gene15648 [Halteria grandinella]